jgi:hypothetical protein
VGNNPGSQTGGQRAKYRTTLTITYLKKQAMGKSNQLKKSFSFTKKGKMLTLCSNLELTVGDDVVVDEDVDE